VAVFLGLLVAVGFGTGDFLGGRASSRGSVPGTLVISQAVGFAGSLLLAVVTTATVATHDIVLGMCAGILNVCGLALLYRALARHVIGVVAPIAAVVGAVVPVAWGLLRGERPSVLTLVGVVLAICAGALIGREATSPQGGWAAGAALAAVAGLALGASLVFFAETSSDSGMWPVFAARGTAAVLVWAVAGVLVARGHAPRLPTGRMTWVAATAGALDVTATALLLLAVRHGLIVVVAPIAALAPGFTVLWAWALLGERLERVQRIGIAIALVGLVLVSIG
jgi:drug/metabolite transporter (DMT)-like permease